jgi:hypothetical protein
VAHQQLTKNKAWLKVLKISGWVLLVTLSLLVAAILLIRLPVVQNRITRKAIGFLEGRIGTKVGLDNIYISFPKKISLSGVYLEDQRKDTLLYIGSVSIDVDLWALTRHRVQVHSIALDNAVTRILRDTSDFNYAYIIQAFASPGGSDTTAAAWDFSLGTVELSSISAVYRDDVEGSNVEALVGELFIEMDEFDLPGSVLAISELTLNHSKFDVRLGGGQASGKPDAAPDAGAKPLRLSLDALQFDSVQIDYADQQRGLDLGVVVGAFSVQSNEMDLNARVIDLNKVSLTNSLVRFRRDIEPGEAKTENANQSEAGIEPWHIRLNLLSFSNNSLQYDVMKSPVLLDGFDPNHIAIDSVETKASDIVLDGNTGSVNISFFSLHDRNGFVLDSLAGKATLSEKEIRVENVLGKTHGSRISLDASCSVNPFAGTIAGYDRLAISVDIAPSYVSLRDIRFFAPALMDSVPLTLSQMDKVSFEVHLAGTVNDLMISKLDIACLDSTHLALDGRLVGLPNVGSTSGRLKIAELRTTRKNIQAFLPGKWIPKSVKLPSWIDLSGEVSGPINSPNVDATLISEVGTVEVHGRIPQARGDYDFTLSTKELDAGKIVKQPEVMGLLDMRASVRGKGLSLDAISASARIEIARFEYKDYTYTNVLFEGSIRDSLVTVEASVRDKNLELRVNGSMDYHVDVPTYRLTADLLKADFKALNLSDRLLQARATLDVDLQMNDLNAINGNVDIRNVAIFNGEALYRVDSLLFVSIDEEGRSEITVRSDIVTGDFRGTFNVFSLPRVFKQSINRYFALQDTSIATFEKPQKFDFNLEIKNTDLLTEILIPALEPFKPGIFEGSFDSERRILNVDIRFADLKYSSIGADSVSLAIDADKYALNYAIRLVNTDVQKWRIPVLHVGGRIAFDSIVASAIILDSLDEEKYHVGVSIQSIKEAFVFRLRQDEVVLNYEPWLVPEDNWLSLGSLGLRTDNFVLQREGQKLIILADGRNSTTTIRFEEFALGNLTRVVEGPVPVTGVVNGDIQVLSADVGLVDADLRVSALTIMEETWGDLTVVSTKRGENYDANVHLTGDEMNFEVNGYYRAKGDYNVDVGLSPFNLAVLEPVSFGQLAKVQGLAVGDLRISNRGDGLSIDGVVTLNKVDLLLEYLNTTFSFDEERLSIRNSVVVFDDFDVLDIAGNKATVNGSVNPNPDGSLDLDLRATAGNFQVLNTRESDNDLYYGVLKLNADAHIIGTTREPKVDLKLRISDDSDLTYVVPVSEKRVIERRGIVKFVDRYGNGDPFLSTLPDVDTIHTFYRGVNLTATIELRDGASLTIVIDPATGDRLSVNGHANLVLDMNASGDVSLSGRYDLTKGIYDFSFYNLTKREFSIESGSTISWSGDPLNAAIDIRALYALEAPPLDLVYNQLTTVSQSEINSYSQRLPFLVYLMIKGKLLEPDIRFRLDMPESQRSAFGGSIYARLMDINSRESDLNKQVFSLLILKRFISDSPFESQVSSTVSNVARQSVSRLLSDQLNRLSENVSGVELNFDIKSYEDYSGDEVTGKTKVQLGVTKNLFDDRLIVKLSGNVDVEGGDQSASNITDYIGDIALEYKLTTDGRFRITGFRNSDYDVIDGELTETGAGLIYIKDYNTLRELFRSNGKE